jgi:hypothetical protein
MEIDLLINIDLPPHAHSRTIPPHTVLDRSTESLFPHRHVPSPLPSPLLSPLPPPLSLRPPQVTMLHFSAEECDRAKAVHQQLHGSRAGALGGWLSATIGAVAGGGGRS